eukprot:760381-Hanusia_phi.AAC.5
MQLEVVEAQKDTAGASVPRSSKHKSMLLFGMVLFECSDPMFAMCFLLADDSPCELTAVRRSRPACPKWIRSCREPRCCMSTP